MSTKSATAPFDEGPPIMTPPIMPASLSSVSACLKHEILNRLLGGSGDLVSNSVNNGEK